VKTQTITSLSPEQLMGQTQPAWARLDSQERARQIQADQERTRETVRAIEAGESNAPKMPGDIFSLNERMKRTLTEYRWLKNGGPSLPDFYFRSASEAAENVRAVARAMVSASEVL
jgi:hypothetical protein